MTYKRVMFRSAAREKVLRGATQLADAVRVTLGPKSKSVLIQKKWGPPLVYIRSRLAHPKALPAI
jgi:chaperonin GroEL